MKRYASTGVVPVLLVVSVAAAWAAPTVTEEEILARLDGDFPAVVSSASLVPLARAELTRARTLENPVLEFVREDPSGPIAQSEWLVSWQLPGPDRRLEIDAAEQSVDAASARVDQRLRSLRARVREAYAEWAVASARRDLLHTEAERLDALATRERARAEKGESSGLEARRLGLAAAALRARLSLAGTDEMRARGTIRRWWPDLAPDAEPVLPALPAASDPSPGARPDLSGEHPLVAAARAEAEAAEFARRAAERYLSAPELTVGWQRQEAFAQEENGPVIGIAWSVPLFDRQRATREATRARRDAARAEAERASREIAARREIAITRLDDLARETAAAKTALGSTREMLLAAETSFRYGELALTDLLEIQRSVTDAHLAWLDLHAAALAADRELETLAGDSSPTIFTELSPSQNEESDS